MSSLISTFSEEHAIIFYYVGRQDCHHSAQATGFIPYQAGEIKEILARADMPTLCLPR